MISEPYRPVYHWKERSEALRMIGMGRRGAELILTPQLVGEVQRSVVCVGFPPYGTVQ